MSKDNASLYEMTLLFKPDLSELELQKALDKIKSSITSKEGHVEQEHNWGKKRLAYPIKKSEFGFYYTFIISKLMPETISPLTRELELSPDVLRYLIISLKKDGVTVDQLFTPAKEEAFASTIIAEKMAPKFKPRRMAPPVEVKPPPAPKIDKAELDEKIEELLTKDIE